MSDHGCCPQCADFVASWDDDTEWLIEWWGGCCCVDTANKARAKR